MKLRNGPKGIFVVVLFCLAAGTLSFGENRALNYSDFTAVSVGYGMHLDFTQAGQYRVEVEGETSDLERLDVEKRGDTLVFTMKRGGGWFNWRNRGITVNIEMPTLKGLNLSGGSEGRISMDAASEDFSADVSGGSSLEGQLRCAHMNLGASGGSDVELNGEGKDLKLDGSGGSEFRLADFAVRNVDCELSGGSSAHVSMDGVLNTDQSGGSQLYYEGNATLGKTHFSGGSSATKH